MNRSSSTFTQSSWPPPWGWGVCARRNKETWSCSNCKRRWRPRARRINDLEAQLSAQRAQNAAVTQSLNSSDERGQSEPRGRYGSFRGADGGLWGQRAYDASGDQTRERMIAALSDLRLMDEQKRLLSEALVDAQRGFPQLGRRRHRGRTLRWQRNWMTPSPLPTKPFVHRMQWAARSRLRLISIEPRPWP